jgi:CBS domain-containing protein
MTKAFEVMTRSLATCTPDARLDDVAALMRDRNIGSVLILNDGELQGIVTDRDLVIHAFTGKDDPLESPVKKYMSAPVVTGEADWSLEHVSEVMAKHQIRRLPIIEAGQLTGIVSLGDVALHEEKQKVVANSLHAISQPNPKSMLEIMRGRRVGLGLMLAASALTIFALLATKPAIPNWRKKAEKSAFYATAQHGLHTARGRMDTATAHDAARQLRDLRRQFRTTMDTLATQVPALHLKPKRRHFWSV